MSEGQYHKNEPALDTDFISLNLKVENKIEQKNVVQHLEAEENNKLSNLNFNLLSDKPFVGASVNLNQEKHRDTSNEFDPYDDNLSRKANEKELHVDTFPLEPGHVNFSDLFKTGGNDISSNRTIKKQSDISPANLIENINENSPITIKKQNDSAHFIDKHVNDNTFLNSVSPNNLNYKENETRNTNESFQKYQIKQKVSDSQTNDDDFDFELVKKTDIDFKISCDKVQNSIINKSLNKEPQNENTLSFATDEPSNGHYSESDSSKPTEEIIQHYPGKQNLEENTLSEIESLIQVCQKDLSANEWDNLPTIEPNKDGTVSQPPQIGDSKIATYDYKYFFDQINENQLLLECKDKIVPVSQTSGFLNKVIKFFTNRTAKLNKNLVRDRDIVFSLAASPINSNQHFHADMLQVIYYRLTNDRLTNQRFGAHWEQIGFQGHDPATDLRGTGILSLYHLVYLLTSNSQLSELATLLFSLSNDKHQNFPFCVMSINITRIVLVVTREGLLNSAANKSNSIVEITNKLYAALMQQLYLLWYHEHKTILDSGFVLAELEKMARQKSQSVLQDLEKFYSAELKLSHPPKTLSNGKKQTLTKFDEI